MVKTTDLLLLLGGGYILYRSSKGISDAAGGIGEGVGEAGRGLGSGVSQIAGGIGQGSEDLLTFLFGPGGELGRQLQADLQQAGTQGRLRDNREFVQESVVDVGAFEQTQEELTNIQAQKDILKASENLKRTEDIEGAKSNIVEFVTSGSILNPFSSSSLLSSFIKTSAGVVSNAVNSVRSSSGITGAAVAQTSSTSQTSTRSSNLRSGGQSIAPSVQTNAPTPREAGLRQSLPPSERNKPAMSVQPTTKPSIRQRFSSFFSRIF